MPETTTKKARDRTRAQLAVPGRMPTRKDQSIIDYPRAEDREPNGELFGVFDIGKLLGVRRAAAIRWVERSSLPPADGPDINDQPTWTRPTVILWLMARRTLPDHLLPEYESLMRDRGMRARFDSIVTECA